MYVKYFQAIICFMVISKISAQYTFDEILDGARRVKEYILKNKKLPKIVGVSNSEVSMVKFTYAMGVAILNTY